jgi:hypothetical protein
MVIPEEGFLSAELRDDRAWVLETFAEDTCVNDLTVEDFSDTAAFVEKPE